MGIYKSHVLSVYLQFLSIGFSNSLKSWMSRVKKYGSKHCSTAMKRCKSSWVKFFMSWLLSLASHLFLWSTTHTAHIARQWASHKWEFGQIWRRNQNWSKINREMTSGECTMLILKTYHSSLEPAPLSRFLNWCIAWVHLWLWRHHCWSQIVPSVLNKTPPVHRAGWIASSLFR